jgi:hypothetical protein
LQDPLLYLKYGEPTRPAIRLRGRLALMLVALFVVSVFGVIFVMLAEQFVAFWDCNADFIFPSASGCAPRVK